MSASSFLVASSRRGESFAPLMPSSSLREPRAFGGQQACREHNDAQREDAGPIGDEKAWVGAQPEPLVERADIGVLHETPAGLTPGQVAEADDLAEGDPPPGDRAEDRGPSESEQRGSQV